jgi:conjugal transfer pilus assembly protein TraW
MKKSGLTVMFLTGFLLAASTVCGEIMDLGTVGRVYPIAEKDCLNEIREKAKKLDWEKITDESMEMAKNYKPENLVKLPKATQDRTFLVDMSYTLGNDIPDKDGKIIYPKGYRFNPLEYIDYPIKLVVIDGSDSDQVAWFQNSLYTNDYQVRLLITDGYHVELREKLNRPIYYAHRLIVERLQLDRLPCIVIQKGVHMEVKEIAIVSENK